MFEHPFLCGTLRFAPGMRVVEGHVHLGMAHDRLNNSRVFLLVHKERGQRMTPEVVKAESLHRFAVTVVGYAVRDHRSGRQRKLGAFIFRLFGLN